MHHERLWYTVGDLSWDVSSSRPGVQVTYTAASGVVLQAFSDASVRQTWPQVVLTGAPGLLPGEPQDPELARSVTAFGVIVSERLSGRKEAPRAGKRRGFRGFSRLFGPFPRFLQGFQAIPELPASGAAPGRHAGVAQSHRGGAAAANGGLQSSGEQRLRGARPEGAFFRSRTPRSSTRTSLKSMRFHGFSMGFAWVCIVFW